MSLSFWRGAGVLTLSEEETVPHTTHTATAAHALPTETTPPSAATAETSDPEEAEKQEALKNWKPVEIKENTNIDEFGKMDIRVATVLDCQPVKKSDRLLQFRLDDGMGGRTILSGIAQSYPDPSVLVGKQVLFIANFPPRKMMGIESQGMILSAVDADGKLVVTTVTAPVKNGSQVG
jgi:methionyl-tRNA synthetase